MDTERIIIQFDPEKYPVTNDELAPELLDVIRRTVGDVQVDTNNAARRSSISIDAPVGSREQFQGLDGIISVNNDFQFDLETQG